MTPSKHNDNQGNSNGNNRDNQDGRGNPSLPNIGLLPNRPPFFRQEERPYSELTPEEQARRSMACIEMALQIIQGDDPTITGNPGRRDRAPHDPSRRTQ